MAFLQPRSATKEPAKSYLRRMSSFAHTRREGLKLRKDGTAELGLFMADAEALKPKHSHFIANGFPSSWQPEEILQFVGEQKWQDASVISRCAKRNEKPTWWLRAIPPGEGANMQDCYAYEVDGQGWGVKGFTSTKRRQRRFVATTCNMCTVEEAIDRTVL